MNGSVNRAYYFFFVCHMIFLGTQPIILCSKVQQPALFLASSSLGSGFRGKPRETVHAVGSNHSQGRGKRCGTWGGQGEGLGS